MTLLSVHDLSISFQTKTHLQPAVKNISFTLSEGETLGIVGESGCGKSILAKALIRLLPQSALVSGTVLYRNQNLLTMREKELQAIRGKEIGMIFQDPTTSLNPTMKVGYQITESIFRHYPITRIDAYQKAIELLALVGIAEPKGCFDLFPHHLSGGMRQRVLIAIALSANPRLIIADEPTTALDVTIQAQILEVLHAIQEKFSTSFLFITHDLSILAGFCDRVLVMYAGTIVEEATVDALFARPTHPYTRGLLSAIPRLDMSSDDPLISIPGTPCAPAACGCSFFSRCVRAKKICSEQTPQLVSIDSTHQVACWQKEKQ